MNRVALPVVFALLVLALSPAARASDTFPDVIVTQLKLTPDKAPMCTLCHLTNIGGLMTVVKPFGKKAMELGLVAKDTQGLVTVLNKMQTQKTNVDGDAVDDIDELIAGTDPNVPEGGTAPVIEVPLYGCQCMSARTRSGFDAAAAVWLAGLALCGWRRHGASRRRVERES